MDKHIFLIGMMGCGKSTVGRRLSTLLSCAFTDLDDAIEAHEGRSIPEIFESDGEAAFRALEREAVEEAARSSGAIIATGGGVAIDPRNVNALRQNGRLFFLDRPLEKLNVTPDRPLSRSSIALKQRFSERYPIYTAVCDARIPVIGMPEDVAAQVLGAWRHKEAQ